MHIGRVFKTGADCATVGDYMGSIDRRGENDGSETEVGSICNFLLERYFAVVSDPMVWRVELKPVCSQSDDVLRFICPSK